jgi:chromosome segregation ATPase
MKTTTLLLTLFFLSPTLCFFAAGDDFELNGGINYQSLLSQRQTEWRRSEASLNNQINDLESQVASLRGNITILENSKNGLTRDNYKLADELANCRNGMNMNSGQQDTINQLTLVNASLTTDNQFLSVSISDLRGEVEKILAEKEGLNNTVDSKNRDIADLENDQLNLNVQFNSCRNNLNKKEELIDSLRGDLSDNDALNGLIQQLSVDIELTTNQTSQYQIENNNLQLTIGDLDAKINKLSALPDIIVNLESEIDSLRVQNDDLRAMLNNNTDDFNSNIGNCEEANGTLVTEVNSLRLELSKSDNAKAQLQSNISELTIIIQSLESNEVTVNELTILVNDLSAELDDSQKDNKELRVRIEELNSAAQQIQVLEEEKATLSIEINNLTVRITEVSNSISNCKGDTEQLRNINSKLGKDIRVLTGELDLKQFANDGNQLLIGDSNTNFDLNY